MPKIMICSGAGLSAESGIPTFRDSGGLWDNFSIDEVCNISSFLDNYIKVNEFYDIRRKQLSQVEPNMAHRAIADLCEKYEVINTTTNVDDLLERAGCENVIHLHGYLPEVVHCHNTEDANIVDVKYGESGFEDLENYPVKPNVVFFGESAPLYQRLEDDLSSLNDDDLLVIIGSSEQVVSFVPLARYVQHVQCEIHFVNVDNDLCMEQFRHRCKLYNMSATEYFDMVDFDELMGKVNE